MLQVQPTVKFAPRFGHDGDLAVAKALVKPDRARVFAADRSDHRMHASVARMILQSAQQSAPDAPVLPRGATMIVCSMVCA